MNIRDESTWNLSRLTKQQTEIVPGYFKEQYRLNTTIANMSTIDWPIDFKDNPVAPHQQGLIRDPSMVAP